MCSDRVGNPLESPGKQDADHYKLKRRSYCWC